MGLQVTAHNICGTMYPVREPEHDIRDSYVQQLINAVNNSSERQILLEFNVRNYI